MAWEEELFAVLDDLEQQAEALYDAERDADLADRSRAAYRDVTLASRLAASLEAEIRLEVVGVGTLAGVLERVGDGWCVLRGPAQDWVVCLPAVAAVHGASPRSVPEVAWPAVARLGLSSALRRFADAGERCVLHLREGASYDGVPRRVGADFVEISVGEPSPSGRADHTGRSGRTLLLAFSAIAAVQSR